MNTRLAMTVFCCLAVSLCSTSGRADEKVPLDKVPAAVLKAVKAKFPAATIKQAEKEVEDGKTTYELGIEQAGQKIDIALKEDGTILEIEKQIAPVDLPKVVADAVKTKYPKGTIKKAEEVTKGDKKTFELIVTIGDKSREVVLDPAGKIVDDEEGDED